jgi:protein phosphatase
VFGVADGMGGHQAGEVASAIAVQTLRDRLAGGAANIDVAEAAIVVANTAIYQGARDNVEQRGMGTTLTAMIVLNDREPTRRFVLLNVGDSRTYLLRGGRLRRVTVDHSYVQELVASGHITEVEARTHPRRNIVTRALGIEPTVRLDSWVLPFVKGDRYVLCSDGLVDEVDDVEIAQVLAAQKDVQRAAQALVDAANAHGGRDNVTVVVVDVLEGDVTVDDTADLDLDLVWIDQSPGMHIDADADRDPITEEIPIAGLGSPAPPVQSVQRRRFGFGTLLFWFGIAVVITGAVTMVLAVRNNASNDPDPVATTTVVATTTSVARTTTTTSPTTTSPTTTTAATPTSGG